MTTPLRITAHLEGACAGIVGQPFMLDGPLAWAEATTGDYPPLTRDHAPEIPVPLATWEKDTQWGYCTSKARYEVTAYSMLEIRRKPSDQEYARFTREKKNHHALGAYKARDLVVETAIIPSITWNVVCTEEDELRLLLDVLTHLGAHRALGLGKVREWEIQPGMPDAWKDRPFDPPCRAPYWHPERNQ